MARGYGLVRRCRSLTSRVGPGPSTMPRATRDCAELEGRVDHGLGDYGAGGPEAGPDRDGGQRAGMVRVLDLIDPCVM